MVREFGLEGTVCAWAAEAALWDATYEASVVPAVRPE